MYSQKDTKWKNEKLGGSQYTIGGYGCYVTSIANLEGTNPLTLNELLTRRKCFQNGLILSQKVAEVLGYTYSKHVDIRGKKLQNIVICETDHYKKKGIPQHFFLYDRKEKKRIDPLDLNPQWEDNDYKIVSYRVFEKKEESKPVSGTITSDNENGVTMPVNQDNDKSNIPVSTRAVIQDPIKGVIKISQEYTLGGTPVAPVSTPAILDPVQEVEQPVEMKASEEVQYNEELPTKKETIVLLIVIAFLVFITIFG